MNPSAQFAFKPVAFANVRTACTAPVGASVRLSNKRTLTIRINAATSARCHFKKGELIVPFVDLPNRAVLLLSGQRPIPKAARPLYAKTKGKGAFEIEYPRVDELAELFAPLPMRGMDLREAAPGRMVFVVPSPTRD